MDVHEKTPVLWVCFTALGIFIDVFRIEGDLSEEIGFCIVVIPVSTLDV